MAVGPSLILQAAGSQPNQKENFFGAFLVCKCPFLISSPSTLNGEERLVDGTLHYRQELTKHIEFPYRPPYPAAFFIRTPLSDPFGG